MRTPFIAGNWKMNKNPKETQEFLDGVKGKLPDASKVETVIGAPAIDLTTLVAGAEGTPLKTAAENCYFEDEGAFTGETSPKALKEMNVDYVIIGHSERRGYFHETDEDINKKAKAIFKNNLLPIICCGESLAQREAGQTEDWVASQIEAALAGLSADQVKVSVLAYEPIWLSGQVRRQLPIKHKKLSHIFVQRLRSCIIKIRQMLFVFFTAALLNQRTSRN